MMSSVASRYDAINYGLVRDKVFGTRERKTCSAGSRLVSKLVAPPPTPDWTVTGYARSLPVNARVRSLATSRLELT